MKYFKHFLNRISSYIYFKTMSTYTLEKMTKDLRYCEGCKGIMGTHDCDNCAFCGTDN